MLKIIVLADKNIEFHAKLEAYSHIESNYDITRVETYKELTECLNKNNYAVIVTLAKDNKELMELYPEMFHELPSYEKIKWFNFYNISSNTPHSVAEELVTFYARTIDARASDHFSIVTAAYHTKNHVINRTYDAIKKQTCKDWEWIIIDDSKDVNLSKFVKAIADSDFRVKYYNLGHSGYIGDVKRKGFSLASGEYLLELDHDDVLMPDALSNVRKCFNMYSDAGFVYSDCAEVEINKYDEITGFRNYARNGKGEATKGSWGHCKTGTAVDFKYNNYNVMANVSPFVNPQSIRHITGAPNHLRCWRRDVYEQIQRHSAGVPIADDYELIVRTFLHTKFIHLNNVEYVQFYEVDGSVNTQYDRNPEIQRLTNYFSSHYDKQIHDRILELGFDDYCWNEELGKSTYWEEYGPCDVKNKMNYTVRF